MTSGEGKIKSNKKITTVGGVDYGILHYSSGDNIRYQYERISNFLSERSNRTMKKIVAMLASKHLSDETLIAILMRRGYAKMDIRRQDGSVAYQANQIKKVEDKMVIQ